MLFDYAVLGNTIRDVRLEKGLSQEVLSGLAGIARTHLTMIENGTMHPTIETLSKIAQALGMRTSELLSMMETRIEAGDKLSG